MHEVAFNSAWEAAESTGDCEAHFCEGAHSRLAAAGQSAPSPALLALTQCLLNTCHVSNAGAVNTKVNKRHGPVELSECHSQVERPLCV